MGVKDLSRYLHEISPMKKEDFTKLTDKYLNNKTDLAEQKLINQYLDAFQEEKIWNSDEMGDLDAVNQRLHPKITNEIKRRGKGFRIYSLRWMSAAAAVLLLIGTAVYFSVYKDPTSNSNLVGVGNDIQPGKKQASLTLADGSVLHLNDVQEGTVQIKNGVRISKINGQLVYEVLDADARSTEYNTISTPEGGEYMLILSEGTRVWLNAASSLMFPTNFNSDERNVQLSGEAYFEVSKDKRKPFIVSTGKTKVTVLGTHFNINSYSDEPTVKTTLLEGSVSVSQSNQAVVLKPGQQSQSPSTGDSDITLLSSINTEAVMSWRSGLFQFENTPLQEVMRQLSRWYGVEIDYRGSLESDRFTGYISRNVKLSSVLNMLEQSADVQFSLKGKRLTVESIK